MLYIIEGPDGAGKTTYAAKLAHTLAIRKDRIFHHGSFRGESVIRHHFMEPMLRYLDDYEHSRYDIIYDRSWVSELVYRDAMKEPRRLAEDDLLALNWFATKCAAVLIYYMPDYEICYDAWLARKLQNGELVTDPDVYRRVYDNYTYFVRSLSVPLPTRVINERI